MVYCGKPSKSCGLCRSRRIKCDQLRPACTQCTRINTLCPGYRNETDLIFRDVSKTVKTKCIASKSKNIKQRGPRLIDPESEERENVGSLYLTKELHSFSDDSAALFFFHNYVVEGGSHSTTFLDTIPDMYRTSPPQGPLVDIISALGLMSLAHSKGVPEVMRPAQERYTSALYSVKLSIGDPVRASADETLIVVILLGLYEDMKTSHASVELWRQHLRGALAILDTRGTDQLKTRMGRQLIGNIRTSTIANCLIRHSSVPESVMRWSNRLRAYENGEEASGTSLANVAASFCEIQERVKLLGDTGRSQDILARALNVDAELEIWAAIERYERPYSSIKADYSSSLAFEGICHVYPSIVSATHWNRYRSIRIMVNEILVTHLEQQWNARGPEPYFECTTPDQQQVGMSESLITTLSQDICASLRFCLGIGEAATSSQCPEKAARAELLLWPLYTAGRSACVHENVRSWIADAFDLIKRVTGVRKAASLSKAFRAWPDCSNGPNLQDSRWARADLESETIRA